MKYLHDAALADITALLSDCPVWSSSTNSTDGSNSAAANSRTLHGRLEAYTTKRAGSDKKLAVNVSGRYVAEQEAAVADDKLAALIHFQKDQLHSLTSNSNISLTGRKRRSASTGEAPLELQKSRRALLSPPVVDGRRGRAYSLDIPKTVIPNNTTTTTTTNSDASSTLGDEICTTTATSTIPPPPPPQPNFRALSLAAVNRRLLTDLILTLNHSFPDYDFESAAIADFKVCSVQTAVTRINERLGEFSAATSIMHSSILKSTTAGNGGSNFLSTLWKAVDDVIHLSEVTEVYSYQPSNGEFDEPHSFLKHSLVKNGWGDDEYDATGNGSSINARRTNQSNQYGGVVQTDDDVSEYDDGDDDLDDSRQPHGTAVHREVLWTFNYFFVNKNAKRILLFACIETMTRSGYSIAPIIPTATNKFVHGIKSMNFNTIPENEAVHHQLRNDTLTTPTSELKRNRIRRRLKYMRQSSPSILPSDDDISGNDDDEDDDDEYEYDGEEYDDDDSHTIASSSAVSVDFDLDPANAVSGGIPIGN